MSGGVDSSVAAYLMKQSGYDCIGVTMKLFSNEDAGIGSDKTCCSLEDVEDARSVAYKLGIDYYVFNFTDNFKDVVIKRFIESYENGATPNPCIDCNRFIKFEKLFQRAKELYCDYIVTGHYARVVYDAASRRYLLKKGIDDAKDQSYVLYAMTQEQLSRTVLPLGDMKKTEVREIASQNGFINARKHESQDICFVPDGDYARFIENYTGNKYETGNFIDEDGNILGRHKGIIRYTKGQRKGLGLSLPESMYVKSVDAENNTVTLTKNSGLFSTGFYASDFNWIAAEKPDRPVRVMAKTRYKQKEQWATAEQVEPDKVHIVFDEPQRAITKGQAVVLYDGDVVVGGGTIL